MALTIAVVDDDPLYLRAIRSVLDGLYPSTKVQEFQSTKAIEAHTFDLILLDYHLPDLPLDNTLRWVATNSRLSKIVVVSADENPRQILKVMEQGALGFIPKSSDVKVFVAALELVMLGQPYIPHQWLRLRATQQKDLLPIYQSLGQQQRRVLDEALRGKPNKVIAIELNIAIGTVKSHLSGAYKALGVTSRAQAINQLAGIRQDDVSE